MIQMCMGKEYVTNRAQVSKRKITYASAGVDQDVIVDQQR